ncbi:hypothetical protein Pmar_PMAR012021 [Perkinsus marinus ATCC 50983]|uniref:Uncharacterized protein n=1 Tax=Perkinsus marinus (strain ATCC 50983 / TXsc) TaxID=423536 RepID=C5LW76_PERM5|nr:hypothetical protein Pmar_PMAR012021 [Perkinsus marinus ATCC 50983]EEQ99013.1 hypothetical protein Pmar_PMAR012021 [Perkinsus marinus ATCC 50983]|eukprot:XP_002766296.1 hypothetical protein Pmar_PMAR012021 [Perkinsus marinus ATCC 50983]
MEAATVGETEQDRWENWDENSMIDLRVEKSRVVGWDSVWDVGRSAVTKRVLEVAYDAYWSIERVKPLRVVACWLLVVLFKNLM